MLHWGEGGVEQSVHSSTVCMLYCMKAIVESLYSSMHLHPSHVKCHVKSKLISHHSMYSFICSKRKFAHSLNIQVQGPKKIIPDDTAD